MLLQKFPLLVILAKNLLVLGSSRTTLLYGGGRSFISFCPSSTTTGAGCTGTSAGFLQFNKHEQVCRNNFFIKYRHTLAKTPMTIAKMNKVNTTLHIPNRRFQCCCKISSTDLSLNGQKSLMNKELLRSNVAHGQWCISPLMPFEIHSMFSNAMLSQANMCRNTTNVSNVIVTPITLMNRDNKT